MNKYEIVESAPRARGKKELLKHLSGKHLTRSEALLAKCYECMGYYVDGKADCRIYDCPLSHICRIEIIPNAYWESLKGT